MEKLSQKAFDQAKESMETQARDLENWKQAENERREVLTLAVLRSLQDFGRIENISPLPNKHYKYHLD
jgi:hypothetical protein